MTTPSDRFAEKTTPYLRGLIGDSDALRTIYVFDPKFEDVPANPEADLFFEKRLTTTKGLVHKYQGRALFLLTYTCAAHCRYCERQDRVGLGLDAEGRVADEDIDHAAQYLEAHPDVTEVIFSGGDPLTHPRGLEYASRLFAATSSVRVLRIHTRFPMQMPDKVDYDMLSRIVALPDSYYLSLHVDHPDELTPPIQDMIRRLRALGYILLSQSVFLAGVNDSVDVLAKLFTRLAELGVRPYYIYHCQPIPTTMRFVMSLEDEVAIMSVLRERLSGLAFPQHVLELQHTTGKVLVPTNHWRVDLGTVRDFNGDWLSVSDRAMKVQSNI